MPGIEQITTRRAIAMASIRDTLISVANERAIELPKFPTPKLSVDQTVRQLQALEWIAGSIKNLLGAKTSDGMVAKEPDVKPSGRKYAGK